jgi:hypothetical protein
MGSIADLGYCPSKLTSFSLDIDENLELIETNDIYLSFKDSRILCLFQMTRRKTRKYSLTECMMGGALRLHQILKWYLKAAYSTQLFLIILISTMSSCDELLSPSI